MSTLFIINSTLSSLDLIGLDWRSRMAYQQWPANGEGHHNPSLYKSYYGVCKLCDYNRVVYKGPLDCRTYFRTNAHSFDKSNFCTHLSIIEVLI